MSAAATRYRSKPPQLAPASMGGLGRRRRRRLWPLIVVLVVAALVGLGILAVRDAKLSPATTRQSEVAWLDLLRPFVEQSNQTGATVFDLRNRPDQIGLVGLQIDLKRIQLDTASVKKWVSRLASPSSMAKQRRLIQSAVDARYAAAATYANAMNQAVGSVPKDQAVASLDLAGREMRLGDYVYASFIRSIPRSLRRSAALPSSVWIDDPSAWSQSSLGGYVDGVRGAPSLAVNHDVAIITVPMNPSPITLQGTTLNMAATRTLSLSPTLANIGNQDEADVPVTATLKGPSGEQIVRSSVNLAYGQHLTVTLPPLRTALMSTYSLLITVGPVPGQTDTGANTNSFTVVVGS